MGGYCSRTFVICGVVDFCPVLFASNHLCPDPSYTNCYMAPVTVAGFFNTSCQVLLFHKYLFPLTLYSKFNVHDFRLPILHMRFTSASILSNFRPQSLYSTINNVLQPKASLLSVIFYLHVSAITNSINHNFFLQHSFNKGIFSYILSLIGTCFYTANP